MSRRGVAAAARRRSVTIDPVLSHFWTGNTGGSTTSGTTTQVTTTADIVPGELIVIAATRGTITGDTDTVTGVAVSAGATNGFLDAAQAARASTSDLHLLAALCTTLIPAGSTITVTFASSAGRRAMIAATFTQVTSKIAEATSGTSGIGGDGGTSAGPNGNSTTPSATTTGSTTTARCLVVAASTLTGGHTSTPGAGYSEVAESQTTTGTGDKGLQMEWKFVTATGAQTAGNTISATQVWAAVVAAWPITA